jgi:hypothetical protein
MEHDMADQYLGELTPSDHHSDLAISLPPVIEEANITTPLLELPPELRNEIYHLVLHRSRRIVISGSVPEVPLILTCKQIRSEARPIFYGINKFSVRGFNYSGSKWTWLSGIAGHLLDHYKIQLDIEEHPRPVPNWADLIEWCHQVHQGSCRLTPVPKKRTLGRLTRTQDMVVIGMFDTVKAMRSHEWEVVALLMNGQREILENLNWRWRSV